MMDSVHSRGDDHPNQAILDCLRNSEIGMVEHY
jgi:hypothetical protein